MIDFMFSCSYMKEVKLLKVGNLAPTYTQQ